jgi:hypothetical protein
MSNQEVDYGNANELAALLKDEAARYASDEGDAPTYLYAQFSRSNGWEVVFDTSSQLAASMTQWDTSDDVAKLFEAIKAGDDDAAVNYAGDILGGWESEWDDE